MSVGQDRLAGFVDTFAERGLALRRDLIAEGDFSISSGFDAMTHLLEVEPRVDAVFAASDLTALGVMRAIEASGRRVFDDVAVIGFDDISAAETASPALTTVRQPIEEIGRSMADLLLRRLAGEDPARVTILPVELLLRGTA
jgi:DNA-binding LacI/PurR family transcriptional regulator